MCTAHGDSDECQPCESKGTGLWVVELPDKFHGPLRTFALKSSLHIVCVCVCTVGVEGVGQKCLVSSFSSQSGLPSRFHDLAGAPWDLLECRKRLLKRPLRFLSDTNKLFL